MRYLNIPIDNPEVNQRGQLTNLLIGFLSHLRVEIEIE